MKKALLIFLLVALPWQALASAERAFAHFFANGSQDSHAFALQHFIKHSSHVLHHHDDGDERGTFHEDGSAKSVKHIFDYDQAGKSLAAVQTLTTLRASRFAETRPVCALHAMSDCPSRPLFRPPRTPV